MRSTHILIADDNLDLLFVVSEALRSAGYRVSEAGSRERAEGILREGDVDLVIADSVLRGDNGDLLARNAGLPVILMSGDPAQIVQSDDSPSPFLAKPFNRADLLLFVSQVLEKAARK
jgi:two-component system nitrogen regulation response regulator GlnG